MKKLTILSLSTFVCTTSLYGMEQTPIQVQQALKTNDTGTLSYIKKDIRKQLHTFTAQEQSQAHMLLGRINRADLKKYVQTQKPDEKTVAKKAEKAQKNFTTFLSSTPKPDSYTIAWAQYNLIRTAQHACKEIPQASLATLLDTVATLPETDIAAIPLILSTANLCISTQQKFKKIEPLIQKLKKIVANETISIEQWLKAYKRCFTLIGRTNQNVGYIQRLKETGLDLDSLSKERWDALCDDYQVKLPQQKTTSIGSAVLIAYALHREGTPESLEMGETLFKKLYEQNTDNQEFKYYYARTQLKQCTPDKLEETKESCRKLKPFFEAIKKESTTTLIKQKAHWQIACIELLLNGTLHTFKEITQYKTDTPAAEKMVRKALDHCIHHYQKTDKPNPRECAELIRLLNKRIDLFIDAEDKAHWLVKKSLVHRYKKEYSDAKNILNSVLSLSNLELETKFNTLLFLSDTYSDLKDRKSQLNCLETIITAAQQSRALLTDKANYYAAVAHLQGAQWYFHESHTITGAEGTKILLQLLTIETFKSNQEKMAELKESALLLLNQAFTEEQLAFGETLMQQRKDRQTENNCYSKNT